nr:threonine--tRNA ligase [Nanoarchaeum sp.]
MKKDLEALRHSASHILAQAVLELFPKTKLAIGPAIENGFYYDFDREPFTPEELNKIEERMHEIVKRNLKIERQEVTKAKAKELLKNQPYKLELLDDLKGKITFYKQGEFTDLCAGPHVESTGEVKNIKLMKTSGAYWRGDSKNKMLQRIYGTAFYEKQELKDYIHMLEEAEKRNHVKLGKELDLFSIHEEGPGFPFFHHKGLIIWNILIDLWRKEHDKAGYIEHKTPMILNRKLWETSGHWNYYIDNMYTLKIDKQDYAIKPMNCPGGILLFKEKLHSYRELPIRAGEIGLVHRHELSGVLNGLFRVRAFHQDDAHIFMTEEQMVDEVLGVVKLADKFYKLFGLDYHLELSTRPKESIGTDKQWELSTNALKNALKILGKPYKINEGDGAFYGPKIDIHLKDSLGRTWQCGTIQVDAGLPEKFDLTYDGKDGKKHRPVMIHRVIYGSLERFLGILIEHYAGKFPLWLSPVQVKIVTVNDNCNKFAEKLKDKLKENEIRVELDLRSESIGKKVRDAQVEKVNYVVTIGEKEIEKNKLAIRTREGKVTFDVAIDTFIKELKEEITKKC